MSAMQPQPTPQHLAENVMHFARVLRRTGMPVATDRVQTALRALQLTGVSKRHEFHATLAACFISAQSQREIFNQAFHIFWRDPDLLNRSLSLLLPPPQSEAENASPEMSRRLAEAFERPAPPAAQTKTSNASANQSPQESEQGDESEPAQIEAALQQSADELLRSQDFDSMSRAEWDAATKLVAQMRPMFEPLTTRRQQRATRPGQPDWRATLRARAQGNAKICWRSPRTRSAPLVMLADISESMSSYSRMLLHFAHALSNTDARVHSFTFGTRLTPITRMLKQRDPDVAVAQVCAAVADWSGGTRITDSLHRFNFDWSRRVLNSNSTVVLITDGLESGSAHELGAGMQRLHRSCRRLIWLNPLLRYDQFQPLAEGMLAMLPHVDEFRPAHNLNSLGALAQALCAVTISPARH
jgi:uncharacterized protein